MTEDVRFSLQTKEGEVTDGETSFNRLNLEPTSNDPEGKRLSLLEK